MRTRPRASFWLWLQIIGGWAAATASGAELATFATDRFSGAGNCAFCHDPWNAQRAGQPGEAAVLATDWRATMMANSFLDPLWRAVMEAEVHERPELKAFIENKCQTCHAPMAATQARADGTNLLSFAAAQASPLAKEGVGCTLCHQIQPDHLGTPASFNGHFQIGTNREIFGPYQDVFTMPMQRHVNYTPKFGAHLQDSALCATCHTLFTPILDSAGRVVGEFPEQVPYLEWQSSAFPQRGQHCQDCHLPRLDQPVKVSARPPWLPPRAPFWQHQITGGNVFMLRLLARQAEARPDAANASPREFASMIEQTRHQLSNSVRLQVTGRREAAELALQVELENLAGHKFPTGHPYRRAWLHVRVSDRKNRTVFESGAAEKSGAIRGVPDGYAPHRDVITRPDEVQIYQSVLGDTEGQPTWSLLRAAQYLKDNRLPPQGFAPTGSNAVHIAIRGEAEKDPNFNAGGNGRDSVTYRVPLPPEPGTLAVTVELLFQSVPPESVARLLRSNGAEARAFTRLYRRLDPAPEKLRHVRLEL